MRQVHDQAARERSGPQGHCRRLPARRQARRDALLLFHQPQRTLGFSPREGLHEGQVL